MSHWSDFEDELDPQLPEKERQALARVAALLGADRPVPSAGFRGRLRRDLAEATPRPFWRPRRLKLTIGAYAASGIALMLIALVGVLGAGPFAAGDDHAPSQASATTLQSTR